MPYWRGWCAAAVALCMTNAVLNSPTHDRAAGSRGVHGARQCRGAPSGTDVPGLGTEASDEDTAEEKVRRMKLGKCVARMRALRRGLDAGASAPGAPGAAAATAPLRSQAHGWHRRTDDGRTSTDRRASWREDANVGVSKQRDRDRYLPRVRKPRVESYEAALRRQIRETMGSLCPDYDEEELRQIARDDPKARVMVPIPLRQENATGRRQERTESGRALQEGIDRARELLRIERLHNNQQQQEERQQRRAESRQHGNRR